jgi:hypothetical protein
MTIPLIRPAEAPARLSVATRALLACGAIAGPLWTCLVLAQGLTRNGFDFARHTPSLLSDGHLGWIQVTNFILTGILMVAFAGGARRQLSPGRGGTWGPRLIFAVGVGMVCAGVFRADPVNGFPPGSPTGSNAIVTWHGVLHLVISSMSFIALIAACFVFASRFSADDRAGWATYSRVTGWLFAAGFAGAVTGLRAGVVVFAVALVIVWAWVALVALRLGRQMSQIQRAWP